MERIDGLIEELEKLKDEVESMNVSALAFADVFGRTDKAAGEFFASEAIVLEKLARCIVLLQKRERLMAQLSARVMLQ